MALSIFISSISIDFDEERTALMNEIISLQDLFIGMEFFGSDSKRPADYCIEQVKRSDLYVGLIGTGLGSIDKVQNLSFTQIEYNAAQGHIPCLIYLSANSLGEDKKIKENINDKQKQFIKDLRDNHVVPIFRTVEELKLLFLKDFIKLLRAGKFTRYIPQKNGPISFEVLHSITRGIMSEQVKAVGHEKYIREIYTPREAESKIDEYIQFEEVLFDNANKIFKKLEWAGKRYGLEQRIAEPLTKIKQLVRTSETEDFDVLLQQLKTAFYFSDVAELITEIDAVLRLSSEVQVNNRLYSLTSRLQNMPFFSKSATATLIDNLMELRRRVTKIDKGNSIYQDIMKVLPSFHNNEKNYEDTIQWCNDLILQLKLLMEKNLKKCVVFVDKAGSGKTNISCHTAETLIRKHPVILLTGQIELSNEYHIEFHVQNLLEFQLGGVFSDWMNRINDSLRKNHKWLFIIVDGINENSNRPLLTRLLNSFLSKIEHKRIKFILTCRDLMWEPFRETLAPYLFRDIIPIDNYSKQEWRKAVKLYFNNFHIICDLGPQAEDALKNPLLLRFFCEAYKGKQLGQVADIKLLSIFDLYIRSISASIYERLQLSKSDVILKFLLDLSEEIWNKKSMIIDGKKVEELSRIKHSNASLFSYLLTENVVLEEEAHQYSTRRTVRFLYDEFMEYILGRHLFEKIYESANQQATEDMIIYEATSHLETFPSAFGAILFLDQILKSEGMIIHKFIKASFKAKLLPEQIQLIYAFSRVNVNKLDEELISALEKFNIIVHDENKDRLASIILRILPHIPNHRFAKKYVSEVLEVQSKNINEERLHTKTSKDSRTHLYDLNSKVDISMRLPAARYHYSNESRLSAISLLIQRGDHSDVEVIRQGIDRIGKSDLNSALKALELLDCMEDELLFKTLKDYAVMRLPEFRIFSAWLLRYRYGAKPADFLTKLLTDKETRVHEFTFKLFESRFIEQELLENIIGECKKTAIDSWHLLYFIKIFGKRSQFRVNNNAAGIENLIIQTLEKLSTHYKPFVRLEVLRTCIQYPRSFDPQALKAKMLKDPDEFIQRQAAMIT